MNVTEVEQAIKQSNTLREALEHFGFKYNNTTQRSNLKEIIKRHHLDISHFGRNRFATSSRWKDVNRIQTAVDESDSIGTFLEKMGLKNKGSNYKTAKYHLKRLSIDTSHFVTSSNGFLKRTMKAISLSEILEGKHPSYKTFHLKRRLLKEGIKQNVCETCGLGCTWNGKPLTMHLDHIDGNSVNHLLDNLRMLCPNCHSQTETYAGKNK